MKYLLDTCVISDFVKGDHATLIAIKKHIPADLAISCITEMEIRYGLLLNPARAAKVSKVIDRMLETMTILRFSRKEANCAATLRAALRSQGTPIGPYDILIAASAIVHDLILVTANEREFARVSELQCENWRCLPYV